MKSLVKKYPIIIFYTCTLLTVFLIGFITMILFSSLPDYLSVLPQLSPAVAAIITISIIQGKSGIHNLFQITFFKWEHLKWYFIALIVPIIISGFTYIILSFISNCPFTLYNTYELREYFPYMLAMFIGCYGEEIGWRGFMLPQLQKKYSLFLSSLLVGVFWGLWHLYFKNGFCVFIIYMIMVLEISYVISWLCFKTKGYIMVAIIFHTSFNFFSMIFFEKILKGDVIDSQILSFLYGIYAILLFIPCVFSITNMLSKKLEI